MKIAVIQFPGSNCEAESLRAVAAAGMQAKEFLWNQSHAELEKFDGYFIVGGFSYEDRSRSGIIASLDPVMRVIQAESTKGKPVLGICNGAQILVETGMVPGLTDNAVGMALTVNKRISNGQVLGTGFYNAWTYVQLTAPSGNCAFTRHLKQGEAMHMPLAHGEGRFLIPEALLEEMKANGLDCFRYCDADGIIKDEFPTNPNGAVENLAAVCNTGGNVMAMMPHPERSPEGAPLFTSMRDYIAEEKTIDLTPLSFTPPEATLTKYKRPEQTFEMAIDLVITDNECETVRKTLESLGIHATIHRQTHWEITTSRSDVDVLREELIKSGEILNTNKEHVCRDVKGHAPQEQRVSLLVRYRDDVVGQSKVATLRDKLGVDGVEKIVRGTVWHITVERGNIDTLLEHILASHILFNQYSQTCQLYDT